MRVMIIAHGHPDFSKGGAEIAAYNLFKSLRKQPDVNVLFVARHDVAGAHHGGTPFSMRREGEVLFYAEGFDVFKFSQPNKRLLWQNFRELIEGFQPDVIHFHHYLFIGLELMRIIKNVNPNIKIVLTLHEYLAICYQQGQMFKVHAQKLCYQSSPAECHQCFPEQSPQNFFLRELLVKSFFQLVDQFIVPSQFLKDRYDQWGIASEKMLFLDNGQEISGPLPLRQLIDEEDCRGRFAYFGQITQFKGLDILLEAIKGLPVALRRKVHLDIHGSGLERQPQLFREKVQQFIFDLEKTVTFHGPYEPQELSLLMRDVDWVVVPSIWWENSPLVIQEAFKYGRPVICSDIGGMAEKVRHEIDGLHFRVAKPSSLRSKLVQAISNPELYDTLVANIKAPMSIEENADRHLSLYHSLVSEPVS
ncbi:MAG: glycosyltransferase family 4 protein [Deinococcales bacterium]